MKPISLRAIIYFSLVLVATMPGFSLEPAQTTPPYTQDAQPLDTSLRFSIQYYDQKIYYQGDDIYIKATITNGTAIA